MKSKKVRRLAFLLLASLSSWFFSGEKDSKVGPKVQVQSLLNLRTRSIFDSFAGVSGGSGGFRSGWGNVISNAISLSFPSSCVGQLLNIGYLSSELNEDDYPYNPNCGAQSQSNNLCFPGNSLVVTRKRGEIEMRSLEPGEEIQVRDLRTMELRFSRVELMLHRDRETYSEDEWVELEYTGMRRPLVLSPNHLIFIQFLGDNPQEGGCFFSSKIEEGLGLETTPLSETKKSLHSIQAKDARPGDSVIIDSRKRVGWITKVTVKSSLESKVSGGNYFGRFAPLTTDGYLIVNGVLVSSYSKPFPWPAEILHPTHQLLDLLIRPFLFLETHFQRFPPFFRESITRILKSASKVSSKYIFDRSIVLSLEAVRAISLLIR
ncbi:hedgehog-type HINT domain protein [Cryptosporidium felis]|nr:hedgehog-type HINT domain protein [Cryptosporidium felis]